MRTPLGVVVRHRSGIEPELQAYLAAYLGDRFHKFSKTHLDPANFIKDMLKTLWL